jgi:hypothetical protein
VKGYVNGQERISFVDTSPLATLTAPNSKLILYTDDSQVGGEASSGTANYVRVYNGALTANEAAAPYAAGPPSAVPEPSALVLVTVGSLMLAGMVWRRRVS